MADVNILRASRPELIGHYEHRIPAAWLNALPAVRATMELPADLTAGNDAYEAYVVAHMSAAEQAELAIERQHLTAEVPRELQETYLRGVGTPAVAEFAAIAA